MEREWSADILSQDDPIDPWIVEGLTLNAVAFPMSFLFAFHLGFVESLRCCMPTREDNSWKIYAGHVLSLPIRLALAVILMAAVLPFSLIHLVIIIPLKCLCNANKCISPHAASDSFPRKEKLNSPSCKPSCCTWSTLAFSKEQENRAPVFGCKHLMQLLCCTVVIGNKPYAACPVCCAPKRKFSPSIMMHV